MLPLLVGAGIAIAAGAAGVFIVKIRSWLFRDLIELRDLYIPFLLRSLRQKTTDYTAVDLWNDQRKLSPDKVFLRFKGESFTYSEAEARMNKFAWFARERLGVRQGDVVSVLMHNEPDFIWVFFGLLKIGATPSFINYNLRSTPLLHVMKTVGATHLICGRGRDLQEALFQIHSELEGVSLWFFEENANVENFNLILTELQHMPEDAPPPELRNQMGFRSPCCQIFTSGTTGLPKPAIVSHEKFHKASVAFTAHGIDSNDVIYVPLPLYHSAAGVIAVSATLCVGATMVIRDKFSVSHFWSDCVHYDVTATQYIGETCRFLLHAPPDPNEKRHRVRLMVGNGLRPDVWHQFKERFHVPVLGEFYGATEGIYGMTNLTGTFGSVGRHSPLIQLLLGTAFVKFDVVNSEPARDSKTGFCQRITPGTGEPGLFLTKIIKNRNVFDGFAGNRKLTENRIVRDVFVQGDVFFNSGDLFLIDDLFNVFFHDRVGDTFRWKGENVSTTEVSNVISSLEFVLDANVYGVSVPGYDGRCGMAALTLTDSASELTAEQRVQLLSCLHSVLPAYAQPIFIRVIISMDMTNTFKQKKVVLVKEGFDPDVVNDSLYYHDVRQRTLGKLSMNTYMEITQGNIRL